MYKQRQSMDQRIFTLKEQSHKGDCVLYIMSRDQRVADNHALLAAQQRAIYEKLPLIVQFNLLPLTGVRGREHFTFMLEGLEEVAKNLNNLAIPFVLTHGKALSSYSSLISELNPTAVYFDFSPLSGPRNVAKTVASKYPGSTYVVDTHNIIPTWVTSTKLEFAAHTIRRKIHAHLEAYLTEPGDVLRHTYSYNKNISSMSFLEANKIIQKIPQVGINHRFTPGTNAAHKHLKNFISSGIENYAHDRNNIAIEGQSELSPYIHFGQISALRIALEVQYAVNKRPLLFDQPKMAQANDRPSQSDGMNALFEELIVRKELSDNFCLHSSSYTKINGAAEWAQVTLADHLNDPRHPQYSLTQLEAGDTTDEAWNAAQLQMIKTGKMHGYMRMYWAKKILEWSPNPQTAIDHAIYLNDRYSIDGADPNGYVGILWSIAGVHDRPWAERAIFGKIRYMNFGGLKRKFDIESYIKKWTTP